MRIFALSDVHIDYDANRQWIQALSQSDLRDDVLILAGDVSHRPALLAECLQALVQRFRQVLFIPGNHDLWVAGEAPGKTSLDKFAEVQRTVHDCGASTAPYVRDGVRILPLLGWYDDSFGTPGADLLSMWTDFRACRWPAGFQADDIARHFDQMNEPLIDRRGNPLSDPLDEPASLERDLADAGTPGLPGAGRPLLITYSHFLPRIDLVPAFVPARHRWLDPVLGSTRLEHRLRRLGSDLHVYGHSHINRAVRLDGVDYVNNALGTPQETSISARQLRCIATL